MEPIFNSNITYTKSERHILDYLLQNSHSICFLTISELSDILHISEATISRFCRHSGYQDFKDLKKSFSENLSLSTPATKLTSTLKNVDHDIVSDLFMKQQNYLERTLQSINTNDLLYAIELLIKADTIYIHGKGATLGLAQLLHFRLNRFFKRIHILPSGGSELFELLQHVTPNDVLIDFGFEKVSVEGKVIIDYQKEKQYKTILFTSRMFDNPSSRATINLFVYRGEHDEFHSMTCAVALIDSLILLLASQPELNGMKTLSELHSLKEMYSSYIPR